jgi:two-component system, cell cycle sensor histidine kinase and response regulator CckA
VQNPKFSAKWFFHMTHPEVVSVSSTPDVAALLARIRELEYAESRCRHLENALVTAEALNRALLSAAPLVVCRLNRAGAVVDVRFNNEEPFPFSAEKLLGKRVADFIPAEALPEVYRRLSALFETGSPQTARCAVTADGAMRVFEARASLCERSEAVVVVQDVTECELAEAELRESEARHREIFENAHDVICILDLTGRFIDLNPAGERVLGCRRDDALAMSRRETFRWFTRESRRTVRRALQNKGGGTGAAAHYEVELVARDGRRVALEINARPLVRDGVAVAIQAICRDVTERQRAEKALRASEERYRDLFQNANDIMYVHSLDGRSFTCNRTTERILGYTDDDVRQMSFTDIIVSEEHIARARMAVTAKMSGAAESTKYELDVLAKDGRRVTLEVNSRLLLEDGVPIGVQGIARDVTERKLAEKALRESEERFRRIFNDAPIGMQLISVDGRILKTNKSLCRFLGYGAEELQGQPCDVIRHPEDSEPMAFPPSAERRTVWSDRRTRFQCERRFRRKDGKAVWGRLTGVTIRNDDGEPMYNLVMIEDATQRRELEEQLRHAQKMQAVGQLAAGVAHEFNNLLTVVTGYAAMLDRRLNQEAFNLPTLNPLRSYVKEIIQAAGRAGVLTDQMLTFGRKQSQQLRPLEVNAIVTMTADMLRPIFNRGVDIVTELDAAAGSVMADTNQMEQVLTNLAVNARDAMPDGGQITIRTLSGWREVGAEDESDENASPTENAAGAARQSVPYVIIEISDTGHGMSEEVRSRIFEPFYTTKPVGEGTGLGLAVVEGIISQSRGFITVASRLGEGTTFRVHLPKVER